MNSELPALAGEEKLGIAALGERALRERIAAGRQVGDPQADALVERFREMPGGTGWKLFERALEHGIDAVEDAPCELRALLERASGSPAWLDPRALVVALHPCSRSPRTPCVTGTSVDVRTA